MNAIFLGHTFLLLVYNLPVDWIFQWHFIVALRYAVPVEERDEKCLVIPELLHPFCLCSNDTILVLMKAVRRDCNGNLSAV